MKRYLILILMVLSLTSTYAYLNIDVTDVPVPIPANGSNISVGQRFDINVTSDGDISNGFWCEGIYDATAQSYAVTQSNNTVNIMGFSNDGNDIPYGTFNFRVHCWTASDFGASGDDYTAVYSFTRQPYQSTYSDDDIGTATVSTIGKFFIVLAQIITVFVIFLMVVWFINKVREK